MANDKHLAWLMDGVAAWNRWRREEPLIRPDLQGLSLTLAQKQWGATNGGPINFSQVLLREADLRHATLIDADLSGAMLVGADLSGARLKNVDFRNANLAHACFDGADLENARFAGANLSGADLSGARNISLAQIEAAEGDGKTLLPLKLGAPSDWCAGGASGTQAVVSAETLKATAAAYAPSVLRKPPSDPLAERFSRALQGLPRPSLDAVATQARRTLSELPRPRLDAVAGRAKDAFEALPRPSIGAVADKARLAAARLPRPRGLGKRAGRALSGLPQQRVVLIAGLAGLLVFGLGALLALRSLEHESTQSAARDEPAAVADARPEPAIETSPASPAPAKEEPPQRANVTDAGETTRVEDVNGAGGGAGVAYVEERKAEPVPVAPAPAQEVSASAPAPSETQVRLAFAMRAEDMKSLQEAPTSAPIVGSAAQAYIQSYLGQPVAARPVDDAMQRTDLPKPTTLAKAPAPEAADTLQATGAPASVIDYLSMPDKSSDWIQVFIKRFYLSGEALDETELRHIYSPEVDYFGKRKTSLDKVARAKARYYRDWPKRHYELVPGSIDIDWKSKKVADVSFTYTYEVSAANKKKTSKGRGRARLTLDLRGDTGLIVREDGEVIAHN